MTRYTLAEIKRANQAAGYYYFSRDTMRYFHNTMKDFTVRHIGGDVYVVNKIGGAVYRFNPDSGDLVPLHDDERLGILTVDQIQEYLHNRSRRMGF